MKGLFVLFLTGMILAGTGCGSLVPISDSTEAMPAPELVGTWQIVDDTGLLSFLILLRVAYPDACIEKQPLP